MQGVLHVGWRVSPLASPRVWRHCDHCKERRPFDCSGKFRSNAQKKRFDVWLIYRCAGCGQTWNCPIHERCRFVDIGPAEFQAIAENSPALVRHYAHDGDRLRRYADRVEPSAAQRVEKRLREGSPEGARRLVIALALAAPCEVRLERLLGRELALSRVLLRELQAAGTITITPSGRAALRRPARDGQAVTWELSRLAAEMTKSLVAAACGLTDCWPSP
ncbi:MAG: DUF1062 domain-containing protein [Kiloniellales bacterium]